MNIISARCWLLTKADADEERANIIHKTEPELARLMRQDAIGARQVADMLEKEEAER
jgi:hypothetical protein